VIHRFAALSGGLDGNREQFAHVRLSGEIGKCCRAECRFKFPLALLRFPRYQSFAAHASF
jgi:hypothetical protein